MKFGSRMETISMMIGNYAGNLVALKGKWHKQNIDVYSNTGQLKSSTPLNLVFNDTEFNLHSIIGLRNNLVVFCYDYNRKEDKNLLIAAVLDPSGKVIKPFAVVDEILSAKRFNSGSFSVTITDDSSKVLVQHQEPFDKEGMEKIQFKLLDENLNTLWVKPLELPIRDRENTLRDMAIDNNGNVFIVSSKFRKWSERDEPNVYKLFGYMVEKDELKQMELKLEDKYMDSPNILFHSSGELIISGFYRTDWRKGIDGLFYIRMNPANQEIIARNSKDFTKELLVSFLGERKGEKAEKKDQGLSSYVLREIIKRKDGGIVLIAEQYYVREVCSTDPKTGSRTCTYHYYYNDLLVANIAPNGSIEWYSRIPKRQHSTDGGYFSSFISIIKNDKIYFVFNDHVKNLKPGANLEKPTTISKFKKAVVALCELSADGSVKRSFLFTNEGRGVIMRPKIALQNGGGSVTVMAVRKKNYNFIKIDI
jgi:hypothetical protein